MIYVQRVQRYRAVVSSVLMLVASFMMGCVFGRASGAQSPSASRISVDAYLVQASSVWRSDLIPGAGGASSRHGGTDPTRVKYQVGVELLPGGLFRMAEDFPSIVGSETRLTGQYFEAYDAARPKVVLVGYYDGNEIRHPPTFISLTFTSTSDALIDLDGRQIALKRM